MRRILFVGTAGIATLSALPALASRPATLTQALVLAYYNNATLQQQRAALRQADEGVPAALSGWRPTVELSGEIGHLYGRETTPIYSGSPLTTKIGQTRTETVGQATITEPLYKGGKTIASTRQAKNSVYAARAQLLAQEQTVFQNVVQAYVTVMTDRRILELDRSNEQVLQQQLHDTKAQFGVGEITMTSVAQAQASLSQAQAAVEVAQGNVRIARENFRQLVGEEPADKLAPPQPLALPVDSKDAAAKAALRNNPNVIAAEFTDAAAKDAVDVAFSALMPQVSVQASAYSEDGQAGPHTKLTGGSVIGQLTVPLYQGGQEYATIRQARAKEQQDFGGILQAQRTAYANATQAWEGLRAARAAIVSTNEAIKANAIALDGTEREELVGTRTTLDVLNAQQALLNAQVQQVQNISTMVTNSYNVAAAIGRLTARDLGLPVHEYDDKKYYEAVKYAGFGTGEAADEAAGIASDGALLDASAVSGAAGSSASGP